MAWKCKNNLYDRMGGVLFKQGELYSEYDDRGEGNDIAICLLSERGYKVYLVDDDVRNNFEETNNMRETGYYWVQLINFYKIEWVVAKYFSGQNCWVFNGQAFNDKDLLAIDERQIVHQPQTRVYKIDFSGNIKCRMSVCDNEISIETITNWAGNPISASCVNVKEVVEKQKRHD